MYTLLTRWVIPFRSVHNSGTLIGVTGYIPSSFSFFLFRSHQGETLCTHRCFIISIFLCHAVVVLVLASLCLPFVPPRFSYCFLLFRFVVFSTLKGRQVVASVNRALTLVAGLHNLAAESQHPVSCAAEEAAWVPTVLIWCHAAKCSQHAPAILCVVGTSFCPQKEEWQ